MNNLRGAQYFEPYAGGAGAALSLLERNVVSEIFINDADPRVFSFWRAVLNDSRRFVDKILSIPLSITEWRNQRSICIGETEASSFDRGFAAFYMNRCNRSGVLDGAGPIGGYQQAGAWLLSVRFNREQLAERVMVLARYRSQIQVYGLDAIAFMKKCLPRGIGRNNVFVYLDPPYVVKGRRLYLNSYEEKDHSDVAAYMSKQRVLRWVMSYDNSDLIRGIYPKAWTSSLPVRYSLQRKRSEQELIIAPAQMLLPSRSVIGGIASRINNHGEGRR